MNGTSSKARRKAECLIEFGAIRIVVFDLNKFMVVVFCSLMVDPATASGLKEGETPREGFLAPNPRFRLFLKPRRVLKKSRTLIKTIRRKRRSAIPILKNAVSFSSARCAQTTVQIRKEVRTNDERHTDSSSHPHGRVADFDLGTQQNMESYA